MKNYGIFAIILILLLVFTGCDATETTSDANATTVSTTVSEDEITAADADMFTDRDLAGDYDAGEAVNIELSGSSAEADGSGVTIDGSTITITEEGVYVVSGTLDDGMIIVDADEAKVQIVLDDASITNSDSAALYVKSADKVFVTSPDGTENTLETTGTFVAIDDNNIDGAVFAKDNIVFNGNGTLNITCASGHGVVGKDDIKFCGGTYNITASGDGVQANDSVRVINSAITINADEKGIKSDNDEDEEKGFIYISSNSDITVDSEDDSLHASGTITVNGGTLNLATGDDGIHSDQTVVINGGEINISESYEGIEGLEIDITGGDITLVASDDGLNAAGGSDSSGTGGMGGDSFGFGGGGGGMDEVTEGALISISGGRIHITAGGDGIDSNGDLEISGGYTVVEGPTQGDTSVVDFNGTGNITGGTFIGTGGSGMAQAFSSVSGQGLIEVTIESQSSGSEVTLTDDSGNVIASVTPELDYAVVYISTPEMTEDGTYTLEAGNYSEEITLSDGTYSSLSGGMGGFGGQGGPGMSSDSSDSQGGFGGGQGGQGGPGGNDSVTGPTSNGSTSDSYESWGDEIAS